MHIPRILLCSTILAICVSHAARAQAQSGGSSEFDMTVSAAVVSGCTVSAQPLLFSVPVGSTGPLRSSTSISVACAPNVAFTTEIDYGENALGINRRMRNAASGDLIRYEIYQDSAYSRVWSLKSNQRVTSNSGPTGLKTLTAYGEVRNLGAGASGTYVDHVTVTVNF